MATPPVIVTQFHGLRVEISQRVFEAWDKVPAEDQIALMRVVSSARSKFKFAPIREVIEDQLKVETQLRAEWTGPEWVGAVMIPAWARNYELHQLLAAYDRRDATEIHRIAARIEARKKAVEKRPKRWEGLEGVLLDDWINPDGMCLAWFSWAPLERLLRAAGHWDLGTPASALEKRVKRLGLKPHRPSLVRDKHIDVEGMTVKIV